MAGAWRETVRPELRDIVDGFTGALAWSSVLMRDRDDAVEEMADAHELAAGEVRRLGVLVGRWCRKHAGLVADGLEALSGHPQYTAGERFGHDLALTAGRHGSGFWDRDELEDGWGDGPQLGDLLTEVAHELPEEACAWLDPDGRGQGRPGVRFDGWRCDAREVDA